jgi:hypothetical protein
VRLERVSDKETCAFSHYLRHPTKKDKDYRIFCLSRSGNWWCKFDSRGDAQNYLTHPHHYAQPVFPCAKNKGLQVVSASASSDSADNSVTASSSDRPSILARLTKIFAKHRIPDKAAGDDIKDLLSEVVSENRGILTKPFLSALDGITPRNISRERKILGKSKLVEKLEKFTQQTSSSTPFVCLCLNSTTKWGISFTGLKFIRVTHTDNHIPVSGDSEVDEVPVVSRLSNAVPSVLVMLRGDISGQLGIANFASCALDYVEKTLNLKCGSAIHDGDRAEVNAFKFEGTDTLKDVHERKYDLPFDLLCLCHLISLAFSRARRKNKWLRRLLRNLRRLLRLCRVKGIKNRLSTVCPRFKKNRWFTTTSTMIWACGKKQEFSALLEDDNNFEFIDLLDELLPVFRVFDFCLHYFEDPTKTGGNAFMTLTRAFASFFYCGEEDMGTATRSISNDLVRAIYKLTLRCDNGGMYALADVLTLTGMSQFHKNEFVCLVPFKLEDGLFLLNALTILFVVICVLKNACVSS